MIYDSRMEEAQSQRVTELKRQRSLLEQDEKRLRWLIDSKFASARFKERTQADLAAVHEDLKRVDADLKRERAN
jgi:hypothetical protein